MSHEAHSTLDLEQLENRRIAAREWWAERIGWVVISGILLAALLGGFGPGPLSHREASSDDERLTVEYDAVQRSSAPAELRLAFDELGEPSEYVELAFSHSFIDDLKLELIIPSPVESRLEQERVVYRFRTADIGERGHIVYRFEHQSFGPLRSTIVLLPESEVELSQFVFP